MPIASSDIQFRLSGGASNSVPAASIGGAKSSVSAPTGLFADVPSSEAAAGSVDYRCVYVHNANATLTLLGALGWMAANTPSATTTIDVGVGTSVVNGTEQTITDQTVAPSGVTFSPAATQGAGVALGDIPAGQSRAVWLRRTVSPGTAAVADSADLRVVGDTAP